MRNLTKEQKYLIKEAIDLTNEFPMGINKETDKMPDYLKSISLHPEIIAQIIADISFKLYVIHHTRTDKDFLKLQHFCGILDDMKHLLDTKDRPYFSPILYQLKMAYPLIGDDPVLENLDNELLQMRFKKAADITAFFAYAMRISSYLAESSFVILKFVQVISAHKAKSIESQPSWEYIEPIFKKCAAQIKPGSSTQEIGQIFNSYFYAGKGREDDSLEHQLKVHGEWRKKKIIKKLGRFESPTEVTASMRKRHFKNFLTWMDRKGPNRGLEKKIVDSLEKIFWNKKPTQQLIMPVLNQFAKTNTSPAELIDMLDKLQDFAKGIKFE